MSKATMESFREVVKESSRLNDAQPEDKAPDLIDAELDRLADLTPLDYAKARKGSAKRLEVGLGTLDSLVKARRHEQGKGKTLQGNAIVFDEPIPADEEVDGSALIHKLVTLLTRYLVLPSESAIAVALWTIHAYALNAFGVNPRLALLSPEKRCGKSTLGALLGAVMPKPLLCSNITPSVIFRVIERYAPTLFLDEMDSFQDSHEELRGILNSGHYREIAQVIRGVGDDFESRSFSTWSPMILAAIGSLPDTLEDRSVIVRMQRKKKTDKVDRLLYRVKCSPAFKGEVETIKRQCVRWAADHFTDLQSAEPDILDELSDRANDNWSGLFSIAKLCGSEWLTKAKLSALALSGTAASSDTIGEQLLSDIKAIFEGEAADKLSSATLCEALAKLEERPWATWSKGYPITPVKVARLLDKYGVKSQTIREGTTTCKGYDKGKFKDVWERYLSSSPGNQVSEGNKVTTPMDNRENPVSRKVTEGACDVLENGALANAGEACDAVTFQNLEYGAEAEKDGATGLLPYGEEDELHVDV